VTFRVALAEDAVDGAARAGRMRLQRGDVATPTFMPVGTRGAVKHLASDDLTALGAQIVLGNTYHLMLRPGAETIESVGGLNRFNAWDGHSLTDSGGFQIFSLDPKVDDDGATFTSVYDGSRHRLTPESAVAVQEQIGADIQMVLDHFPGLPAPAEVIAASVERTAAWAAPMSRCEPRALVAPSTSASTVTRSAVWPSARRSPRWSTRSPRRRPSCRPTSRAT
jgi:queuine tRNA-ribosyltransferase